MRLQSFAAMVIAFMTVAEAANAHPVPYQGSTGVMMWQTATSSDYWLTHSVTSDFAVAGRAMRYRLLNHEISFNGLQANYLLKRWNGLDYQGNIYLYAGGGKLDIADTRDTAAIGGWEADWESRKYFLYAKGEALRSSEDMKQSRHELRFGVAAYPSGFEELSSWLMIQAAQDSWMQDASHWEITPLVRFYYKNVLWEQGVSLDGNWMLNLMFHL